MKKTPHLLLAATVLVVLLVSACSSPAPVTQAPPPVQQQPTQAPPAATQPPAPTVEQPTQQTFAPACPAAPACAAPNLADVEAVNTYCVQKIPYQNISLPKGTSFEVVDSPSQSEKMKCNDTGTVDNNGVPVVTCTGKQLWTYELKLTNTACGATNLATGTGQCQDGFGYDAAQSCCSPLSANSSASQTIKVNIGACP